MSIKSKIVTAAATLTLAAGVGAAGTLTANAATLPCAANCVNWFSAAFGTAVHPAFVLNVRNQLARPASRSPWPRPAARTRQRTSRRGTWPRSTTSSWQA